MKYALVVIFSAFSLLLSACGDNNVIGGEDYGNIAGGDLGTILTESEHPIGWGKADCFECHNTENMHQTDRTGTGLNLEAIREITRQDGLDSCPVCHGNNGVQ